MRKLLTLLILCFCFDSGYAQLQIEDTINITKDRWRDTCFGLIDKSALQIPSGYLLDYSLADFPAGDLDGVGTNDTIKTYGDYFYYYNILELSAVNTNAILPTANSQYINASRYKRDNDTIPLLFLFQGYQKISPSALSNNLFSVTTDSLRLMDVPGRMSSPYVNNELFIFSPAETRITRQVTSIFLYPRISAN